MLVGSSNKAAVEMSARLCRPLTRLPMMRRGRHAYEPGMITAVGILAMLGGLGGLGAALWIISRIEARGSIRDSSSIAKFCLYLVAIIAGFLVGMIATHELVLWVG